MQVLVDAGADAGYGGQFLGGGEGAVLLAVGDDGLGAGRADAGQGFQLGAAGGVEVNKGGGRRVGVGGGGGRGGVGFGFGRDAGKFAGQEVGGFAGQGGVGGGRRQVSRSGSRQVGDDVAGFVFDFQRQVDRGQVGGGGDTASGGNGISQSAVRGQGIDAGAADGAGDIDLHRGRRRGGGGRVGWQCVGGGIGRGNGYFGFSGGGQFQRVAAAVTEQQEKECQKQQGGHGRQSGDGDDSGGHHNTRSRWAGGGFIPGRPRSRLHNVGWPGGIITDFWGNV